MRVRVLIYLAGLATIVVPSALRIYLLLPFPGSQELDSIHLTYLIDHNLWIPQGLGAVATVFGLAAILRMSRSRKTIALLGLTLIPACLLLWGIHQISPQSFFRQPNQVAFATGASEELPPSTLVLGVVEADGARAYPIRLLAYHHIVMDESGDRPLLPTY